MQNRLRSQSLNKKAIRKPPPAQKAKAISRNRHGRTDQTTIHPKPRKTLNKKRSPLQKTPKQRPSGKVEKRCLASHAEEAREPPQSGQIQKEGAPLPQWCLAPFEPGPLLIMVGKTTKNGQTSVNLFGGHKLSNLMIKDERRKTQTQMGFFPNGIGNAISATNDEETALFSRI